MRSAHAAMPALLLCGCSLISLDDLAEGNGGGVATTTSTAASLSGPATTSSSAGSQVGSTSTQAASTTSATSGGCNGPTFCESSTAQLCDDFDTAASREHWSENLYGVSPPDAELSFDGTVSASCPTSAKSALHVSRPDGIYAQWERTLVPSSPFGAFRARFKARKEEVPPEGAGIHFDVLWRVPNDMVCQVLLYDDGATVQMFAQRFDSMSSVELSRATATLSTPTVGHWVRHDLTIDPGNGVFTVHYVVTQDDGTTTTLDASDGLDDLCGASSFDTALTVQLGNHFSGEGPNTTYFDDVELDFDP